MKRTTLACALLLLALPAFAAPNAQILLETLFQYRVISETRNALADLDLDEASAAEIEAISKAWISSRKKAIRDKLENAFGEDARESFSFFTTRYTQAEAAQDPEFLSSINRQLEDQNNQTYTELRHCVFTKWIKPEIDAAGQWMADVQTWVDLRKRKIKTPSLQAWIARDEALPAPVAEPEPMPKPKPTLAGAEAPLPDFDEALTSDVSPLDQFGSIRQKRLDEKRARAQAAMKDVAAKRKLEEDAYAARKAAEAQREAAAVKAYAQKLASTEAEAMEQRKNSWGARIKRIAVATASGALGAVTSGAGAAAGAVVAEELFGDD